MKNNKLILFAITLLLLTTSFSYAETITKTIEVQFADFTILVDGIAVKTTKQPFVYEGTLYVPINTVLQSTGSTTQNIANTSLTTDINRTGTTYFEGDTEIIELYNKKYVVWRSLIQPILKSKYRVYSDVESLRLYYMKDNKYEYVTDYIMRYTDSQLKGIGSYWVIGYEDYKAKIEPLLFEKR